MSTRRIRVPQLPVDGPVDVPMDKQHHLKVVLRLHPGAQVLAFDGLARQCACTIGAHADGRWFLDPAGPVQTVEVGPETRLLLGLTKPKALHMALRMSVEVGITHIDVIALQRSQNRPPRLDRWQKIMEAAAQQCGRSDVPALQHHDRLTDALTTVHVPLFVAVPGAERPERPTLGGAVLIGPEGGLTESEIDMALSSGAQRLGLGRWVLRADTAAVLGSHFIAG
ncbi:MAG: 16S rRNA (uracil(1498)-N(3))-methyltransferase [Myxococcota bacterium]